MVKDIYNEKFIQKVSFFLIILSSFLIASEKVKNKTLKPKKILSILESKEDINNIFYKAIDFEIDENENIYILDSGNSRIQKFNKKGKYVKTISQKGQGPGELLFPISIKILNNKIFIYDLSTRRITKFNLEGELIDTFKMKEFFHVHIIDFDSEENIYNISSKYEGNTGYSILSKYDTQGNFKKNISNKIPFPLAATGKTRNTKRGIIISSAALFGPNILFVLDKNDNIYVWSFYDSCEIKKYSSNGKELSTLKGKFERIKVKEEDKSYLSEKFKNSTITKFPEYKPFFKSLNIDDKNNIWVETFEGEDKGEIHFHIFSEEGKYLNNAIIKTEYVRTYHKIRIKKDHIYILFYGPEKGLRFEKYKIL